MSKVTAIVIGRPGKVSETLARQALQGAKNAGANEVDLFNLNDFKIEPCIGCDYCLKHSAGRGEQAFHCFHKDDFNFIADKVLDADAILYVMPMFEKSPPGNFKVFQDRIGYFFDMAFAIEHKALVESGKIPGPLPDPRLFKVRPVAFIAHGGSEWTTLGLPTMAVGGISMNMRIVDKLHYPWNNSSVWPVDAVFERVSRMGENLTVNIGLKYEDMTYIGEPGHCPVCHNDVMVLGETPEETVCSVCGMIGTLSIVDGKIQVSYEPSQYEYSHYTLSGKVLHAADISFGGRAMGMIPFDQLNEIIKQRQEPLNWIEKTKPPVKKE